MKQTGNQGQSNASYRNSRKGAELSRGLVLRSTRLEPQGPHHAGTRWDAFLTNLTRRGASELAWSQSATPCIAGTSPGRDLRGGPGVRYGWPSVLCGAYIPVFGALP